MIIGETFSYFDDYDLFGGKGKARRQEKRQVRKVKKSGKKINRLSGRLSKAVGKQQLARTNFGLTRTAEEPAEEAMPVEQPTPAGQPEPTPENGSDTTAGGKPRNR